ncbi:MAG: hypothetical protein J5829_05980 [Lachnospiraceae bacterium]|nr:hypothetical protein [Lachnospiraceae bacterium]
MIIEPILKAQGIEVATFDRMKDIDPDYCGDLREIDTIIKDREFDVVLCWQILEHIEFEHFDRIVKYMKGIVRKKLIISLPYSNISLNIWVQRTMGRVRLLCLGFPRFWQNKIDKWHKWEMGTKAVSKKAVREVLNKYYTIEKEYKCEMYPYHVFFILGKK